MLRNVQMASLLWWWMDLCERGGRRIWSRNTLQWGLRFIWKSLICKKRSWEISFFFVSQCFNPHCFNVSIFQYFNTHSLAGVIPRHLPNLKTFQYALPCGSDSETFTKSGIKKSCKFCQIAKCSVFIITDLWKITILLSLFYKIPVGKPLEKHRFL